MGIKKKVMMENIVGNKKSLFKNSILHLQNETIEWVTEIKFIKIEQAFLKEMIENHILKLCENDNFSKAKLLLNSLIIDGESDRKLSKEIKNHKVNLALLIENIYIKKEDDFREYHKRLHLEIESYIQNFKYVKELAFELILLIMKIKKQKEG